MVENKPLEEYIGEKFGYWEVIGIGDANQDTKDCKIKKLKCKCTCEICDGIIKDILLYNLINKKSKGCSKGAKTRTGWANKKFNNYNLNGEYGIGYTRKNKEFYFDLEDFEKIKNYCWNIKNNGYVSTVNLNKKEIFLHNLIMNSETYHIDHKNRIRNDNRKSNLRYYDDAIQNVSNQSKRTDNTSGIIGVSWINTKNIWCASIQHNYKKYHLGYYSNIEDAIKSRLQAELKYFGEFAPQRHLFSEYNIVI